MTRLALMANYSSAKRTLRDRVFIWFVLGAGATAAAIVTASALAPHPPVAPRGPGVPHDLIAQSGQGLPSFPRSSTQLAEAVAWIADDEALMSIGRPLGAFLVWLRSLRPSKRARWSRPATAAIDGHGRSTSQNLTRENKGPKIGEDRCKSDKR